MSGSAARWDIVGQGRKRSRRRAIGAAIEPLEGRLLMALAKVAGGSGVSANLSTNTTVKKQQLLVDPPDAPISGSISVSYDPTVSHLIGFEPGPGYDNEGFGGYVEVLAAPTTDYEDFTFHNTDWTITTTTTDTGSSVSAQQVNTGEGTYRQISTQVINPNFPDDEEGDLAWVVAFNKSTSSVYNPQTQGGITSLDYSEDDQAFSGEQVAGMALEQNGIIYYAPFTFLNADDEESGGNYSESGLGSGDFVQFNTLTSELTVDDFNPADHPDFSSDGAPITFGFYRASFSESSEEGPDTSAISDWDVTVHQDAPPVPELQPINDFFENPAGPETGFVQIFFSLDGTPGNLSPDAGYTPTDSSNVEDGGVDTYGLTFQLLGDPDAPIPNAAYTVFTAPQDTHSGNDQDFLEASDGTIIGPSDITPASVQTDPTPVIDSTGGPYVINEGSSLALHASAHELDDASLTYSWDLNGDNTTDVTGSDPVVSAATLQSLGLGDGFDLKNITLTVSDGTNSVSAGDTVEVDNVAPTATLGNNGPVNEGSPATVSFTNPLDPSSADISAGLHYSFALSTGALATTYAAAATPTSQNFTFNDNGSYTVYGRVFDKDGGSTTYSTSVIVNNVAPTATLSNNGPVNANSPALVSFTNPIDPSSTDVSAGFHYSFATTTAALASTYAAAGTASSQSFTFTSANTYTVYGRIFDKDGGSTTYSTSVIVKSAGLSATLSNNGPVNEGSAATVSFTNPVNPTSYALHYSFCLTSSGLASSYNAAGTASSQSFTFNDNGSYTVYGRVFDKSGDTVTYSTIITVNNVAPTASISSCTTTTSNGVTIKVLANDPSSTDRAAGFKYIINWGDGSPLQTINATANNGSGVNVSHAYSGFGPYTILVTATDKDGGVSAPVSTTAQFSGAMLMPDPSNPSQSALFVYGTNNGDVIRSVKTSSGEQIKINGTTFGPFKNFSRIIVYGLGGNDDIAITDAPAVLFGGDGNDILVANYGASIVDGGAGNDAVTGLGGSDLDIGGAGADLLYGGSSSDILVAGSTSFDNGASADIIALTGILNEWNRSNITYATKIAQITGAQSGGTNGSFFITSGRNQNVFDDGAVDALAGGSGQDWLILHRTGSNPKDISDLASNETGTNV